MFVGRAVEIFLVCVIAVTLISQILVPLWKGTPMFPFFGKRSKRVAEVKEVEEDLRTAEVETELARKRAKLTSRRQTSAGGDAGSVKK